MDTKETKKLRVKLSPKIPAGCGFYDYYSKTDLYPKKTGEVFEVVPTPFIQQKLATGELILIAGDSPKSDETSKPAKK